MDTHGTFKLWIIVLASTMALVLSRGAGLSAAEGLEDIPVRGSVLPEGTFAGHLSIVEFRLEATDQVFLTGVLNGIKTSPTGTKSEVAHQTFSVAAKQLDIELTTDVLRLQIGPIPLSSTEEEVMLAPVTLDMYAAPGEENALVRLLDRK